MTYVIINAVTLYRSSSYLFKILYIWATYLFYAITQTRIIMLNHNILFQGILVLEYF